MVSRIRARNIGPVREADIRFGDLTIFVGPQATGKSIFLQVLKLLVDKASIHETMRYFGMGQTADASAFFDLYFGEGMASIWTVESCLVLGRAKSQTNLTDYAHARPGRKGSPEKPEQMFYIPAQRVTSLRDGMTHPFNVYRAGDPFVLRDFSDKLHWILQNEIGLDEDVFPRPGRLSAELREPLEEHIFNKFALRTDTSAHQRRLVLKSSSGRPLPYLVWSAGQREFVPLLLGLYWLLPPAKSSRRRDFESVVIEEPEMGLHPNGIGAVLNFVMELLSRGYRVYLSTHSPHVLDIVWALGFFQKNNGEKRDVLKLLGLSPTPKTKQIADTALKSKFRTYYFARDGEVHDISRLDPGSEILAEGGWGGLTEFSGRVGDVVAEVANRKEGA